MQVKNSGIKQQRPDSGSGLSEKSRNRRYVARHSNHMAEVYHVQVRIRLRDSDIRPTLLRELQAHFSDPEHNLILQEFGCNAARIDLAVVNGALHGFEIKSDCDSLERLDSQIVS